MIQKRNPSSSQALAAAGSGDDNLVGTDGDDELRGLAGNDTLSGLGGNDLLDGGTGNDSMYGGAGDDVYYVDSTGDRAVELAYEGFDILYTSVSFADDPAGEIENFLVLDPASTNALDISANRFDNLIRGNEGANVILAGYGDDTVYGFGGNDTISAGDGVDTLYGGGGDDHLSGGEGVDVMYGGAGNDVFDALSERQYGDKNRMYGEGGNDIYYVDRSADQAIEIPGRGFDIVYTVFSYRLPPGSEIEILQGTGPEVIELVGNELSNRLYGPATGALLRGLEGDDLLAGGAGDDRLDGGDAPDTASYAFATAAVTVSLAVTTAQNTKGAGNDTLTSIENLLGSAFADTLTGNGGANRLDGGAGADLLTGGDGNDVYAIDNLGDRAVESSAAGGIDTVQSSVGFVLGANVENLTLVGTGAVNGSGNDLANILTGNGSANVLSGGAGADTLDGGAGNDLLHGGPGNDVLTGGAGIDTASYAAATAGVTVTLASTAIQNTVGAGSDTLTGIENLLGSRFADRLTGDAAANVLRGGGGQDRLEGGAGADSFQFDTAPGAANLDHILDFARGSDRIRLDNAVFTGLADGPLAAGAFGLGSAATNPGQRILYDAATGTLFYDPDGSGAAAAIAFAILDNRPATMAAGDFLVI